MRFQRLLQLPLFLLFLLLLWLAAYPLPAWFEVDLFLRLDPLISLGSMAVAREFIPKTAWAIVVLGLALLLGRVFCGYVCPMGATIDFWDWVIGKRGKTKNENSFEGAGRFRSFKYLILIALAGSALVGISWIFLFSPLSLMTRFYSFVVYPIARMIANLFLDLLRPVLPSVGLESLSYVRYDIPLFNTNLFVASLVLGLLLLGMIRPRFWCRNLCPAGALFAIVSLKPLFRRTVSEKCTSCGRCVRACPMGAIAEDFGRTAHSECITCLKCQEVCPEKAIAFKAGVKVPRLSPELNPGRRRVLGAGATGLAAAALTMTHLDHLHSGETPRALRSAGLIRPPGALPETEFQARCVRCGECMKGCLTNTLQPVWFEAGLSGLWTPKITARLAGCEQGCNLCGQVCPTAAIRPLSLEEKSFAKVGTARIDKTRCIAWEQDKKCLICDEICPYNAIVSQFMAGHSVTVPVIDEDKCNGCGYCECKCPVTGASAIIVEPLGELRLASGSYKEKARELGLVFHAKDKVEDQTILNRDQREGKESPAAPAGKEEKKLPTGFVTN
ncbi:MAG: 4Fe-4S binding protein [Desulfobacterota bacterium]|nr:4Fe-4S binding protein [Thermodesulfobacteriota bacterium]